jgi:hypothetical protein
MTNGHPYGGCRAVLATQHGKLGVVAPPLLKFVGLVVETADVDTDALGTFSGERRRHGTQRETAIEKARLGMLSSGCSLGLASEASFGPLDDNPFVNACLEFLVFVDDELGIQIGEAEIDYRVPAISVEIRGSGVEAIPLNAAGFPEHGLIVRSDEGFDHMVKGIHDLQALKTAVAMCAEASPSRTVRVENDLRAHHSPSRRLVIARTAERLAVRLATLCPRCRAPGWGVIARVAGAPCKECNTATQMTMGETLGCALCAATDTRELPGSHGVDPRCCPNCNP